MFLKKRKGIAINQILKLILASMGLLLIVTVALLSQLNDQAGHGADLIEENTEYRVDIHEKRQLSDLAMFVQHRSDKCGNVVSQNEGEGYPGLEPTYLGRYPQCAGASDTWSRGGGGFGPVEQGQDMEGNYGRERFEIMGPEDDGEAPFTLNTDGDSEIWIENNLYAAANSGYRELASRSCGSAIEGTGPNYNIFFQPDASSERINTWMMDEVEQDNPYCRPQGLGAADPQPAVKNNFHQGSSGSGTYTSITLCPGDKGYIRMNKQDPLNTGEAEESLGNSPGSLFAHIVITETGDEEECLENIQEPDDGSEDPPQNCGIDTGGSSPYDYMCAEGSDGSACPGQYQLQGTERCGQGYVCCQADAQP